MKIKYAGWNSKIATTFREKTSEALHLSNLYKDFKKAEIMRQSHTKKTKLRKTDSKARLQKRLTIRQKDIRIKELSNSRTAVLPAPPALNERDFFMHTQQKQEFELFMKEKRDREFAEFRQFKRRQSISGSGLSASNDTVAAKETMDPQEAGQQNGLSGKLKNRDERNHAGAAASHETGNESNKEVDTNVAKDRLVKTSDVDKVDSTDSGDLSQLLSSDEDNLDDLLDGLDLADSDEE